ncbi:unnamed protein product [Arabidopsis halleri]
MPGRLRQYVRGLICCLSGLKLKVVIYNPTTRQSFHLPEVMHYGTCFFGYDPLENQYKVLFLSSDYKKQACQVFTLGDPTTKQWRKLQGVGSHHVPFEGAVCINGAIYYRGETTTSYNSSTSRYKLMSFDVRSEKIYHVEAPKTFTDDISTLVNYQGKLGFVYCEKNIEIWVMKDAEKETQGWSRIFFYKMQGFQNWCILDATRGGEIVLGKRRYLYECELLRVLYYDPKRNSIRCVNLEGTLPKDKRRYDFTSIWTVPDHVENTMCLY